MNIRHVDLNLLVYLNVLLDERSVSRAADKLALSQPAMSNALKRLRDLFDDPLLVRAAGTMKPTEKARSLKPEIESLLKLAEEITQPSEQFEPQNADLTFRIMANDYIESTLLGPFIAEHLSACPGLSFDILSPADVSLQDMETGTIDLAINRFNQLPRSFHQSTLWRDGFCCLVNRGTAFAQAQTLENYLAAEHVWVSRVGWGPEPARTNQATSQKLGWIDEALWQLEKSRNIRVFTRHYMVAGLLATQPQLIATLPRRLAQQIADTSSELQLCPLPFQVVPGEIKMIWSPLLHHSGAHQWLRRSLAEFAARQ